MTSHLALTHLDSPIGRIAIVADDAAIVTILFDIDGDFSDDTTHNPAAARIDLDHVDVVELTDPGGRDEYPVLADAVRQLRQYFDGEREDFDLPLAPVGTDFQRDAWAALQRIPFGTTLSYGEQAATMGDRRKARAVGAANGKNPIPIVIPCHRVVGADGSLTGFAGGVGVKAWLLAHEQRQRRLPV